MSSGKTGIKHRARWPLPAGDLDTTEYVRVSFCFPNILEYRAAVRGTIQRLGDWWSWELDDAKRGRIAAQVFKETIANTYTVGGVCGEPETAMLDFRFTIDCGLEYTLNGTDWIPVDGWAEFANDCFQGPPGETGPSGPPGEDGDDGSEGYDDDGGVPDPEGEAGDDKSCRAATAIAEGAINEFKKQLDLEIDVLADHAGDANAAYNELRERFEYELYGTEPSGGYPYTDAGQELAGFLFKPVIMDIAGIAAVFAGAVALIQGHQLLDLVTLRSDLLDPDFKQDFVCLILGSLDANGGLSASAWGEIRGAIPGLEHGTSSMKDAFKQYLDTWGYVAKMRVYALRTPAAYDCEDCNPVPSVCDGMVWSKTRDLTLSNSGFTHQIGEYLLGDGYHQTLRNETFRKTRAVWCAWQKPNETDAFCKHIEIDYSLTKGVFLGIPGVPSMLTVYNRDVTSGATTIFSKAHTEIPDGEGTIVWDAPEGHPGINLATGIRIEWICGFRRVNIGQTAPDPGGDLYITRVRVCGDGGEPLFVDDEDLP
jgi:hypothetical protein